MKQSIRKIKRKVRLMEKREFDLKQEYSEEVDKMRKNRIEMSFYKYGPARVNFENKLVDALATHNLCIEKYKQTHNKEYLLDAMNYLMFEFMYPQVDGAFFKATDSSGSAGLVGDVNNWKMLICWK